MFCALGGPLRAEEPKPYWVLADTAVIRSQAKSQAPVLGCLPTGTAFASAKRSGDWVYVDSANEQAVRGWVHVSAVSESEVNEAFILAGISRSKTFADTLQWTERLVSLLPTHKAYLKALQKGYIASGDTARASGCGRRLRGTDPIYLARYDGLDLLVIGWIDSTGEFRNLLWKETVHEDGTPNDVDDSSKAIRKKALALRTSLAAMEWFGEQGRYRRDFFHTPRPVPPDKRLEGYISDVEGTATFGISLGSSKAIFARTREDALFATRPYSAVPLAGITRPSEIDSLPWFRTQLVGTAFDTTGMARIDFAKVGEYGFLDISMGGISRYRRERREARGIFDARRNRVWPPEYAGGIDDREIGDFPRAVPRWFRFGPDASHPAFIVLPFSTTTPPDFTSEMGNYGYHLLRIGKSGFKYFVVRSDYGGC